MGKLPTLVRALAECDERDRATLDHIARVIREAGWIPTTKRGSGASDMTFREAANLLIAASVAEAEPRLAANAVHQYRTLIAQDISPLNYTQETRGGKTVVTGKRSPRDGVFAAITEAETLGEALEALIEGAPELLISLLHYVEDAYSGKTDEQLDWVRRGLLRGDHARVEVTFHRPTPYATIRIMTLPGGREDVQFAWRYQVDAHLLAKGHYVDRRSDAHSTRTVGLRTLLELHAAIAIGGDASRTRHKRARR
jgi:hypothetical protein